VSPAWGRLIFPHTAGSLIVSGEFKGAACHASLSADENCSRKWKFENWTGEPQVRSQNAPECTKSHFTKITRSFVHLGSAPEPRGKEGRRGTERERGFVPRRNFGTVTHKKWKLIPSTPHHTGHCGELAAWLSVCIFPALMAARESRVWKCQQLTLRWIAK